MPVSLPACDQPLLIPTWATEFLRRHDWMPMADGTWRNAAQSYLSTCQAVHHQVTLLELQLISERWAKRTLSLQQAYEALFAFEASSAPLILQHFGHRWVSGFVTWLSEVAGATRRIPEGEGALLPTDHEQRRARRMELELRALGVTDAG